MVRKTVLVDIDGFISNRLDYTSWDFMSFEPIPEMIEKVNELHKKGYTVIYNTSRPDKFYAETKAWLIRHGCLFSALNMGKPRADYYLDDRNADINDLLKGG